MTRFRGKQVMGASVAHSVGGSVDVVVVAGADVDCPCTTTTPPRTRRKITEATIAERQCCHHDTGGSIGASGSRSPSIYGYGQTPGSPSGASSGSNGSVTRTERYQRPSDSGCRPLYRWLDAANFTPQHHCFPQNFDDDRRRTQCRHAASSGEVVHTELNNCVSVPLCLHD